MIRDSGWIFEMGRRLVAYVLLSVSVFIMSSCEAPVEEDSATTNAGGETADDNEKVGEPDPGEAKDKEEVAPNVGTLAVGFDADLTPSESLQVVEVSLKSVPQSEVGTSLIKPSTLAIGLSSGYQDEECDGNSSPKAFAGEPTDGDDDDLPRSHPDWGQRHFYCLTKVGTSPETVIGSIVINKGVLCALEKAGALTDEKSGVEQTVPITIDTECFTPEFVIAMASEGGTEGESSEASLALNEGGEPITMNVVMTYTKLEDDPNWDIKIAANTGDESIYYFKNTKDYLAGARLDKMSDGGFGSGYVFSVFSDGVLSFENRLFPVPGSGFEGTKHIRLMVKGEIDKESLAIKEIERYEGASASLIDQAAGHFNTISGSASTGFKVENFVCSGFDQNAEGQKCWDFANWQEVNSVCVDGGDCTEEDAISITTADFNFVFPGEITQHTLMGDFLDEVVLPLRLESVDLKDIPEVATAE